MTTPEEWIEYRAIFSRPASILDSNEDRKKGFVVERTRPYRSKEGAQHAALYNATESHAIFIGFESRAVCATEWWKDGEVTR